MINYTNYIALNFNDYKNFSAIRSLYLNNKHLIRYFYSSQGYGVYIVNYYTYDEENIEYRKDCNLPSIISFSKLISPAINYMYNTYRKQHYLPNKIYLNGKTEY